MLKLKCWELIFFQPTDPHFNCSLHQTIETNGFISSTQYLCVIQQCACAGFYCEGIVWVYFCVCVCAMSLCNLPVLPPVILKRPTTSLSHTHKLKLPSHWLQSCVRPQGCDDMSGFTDSGLNQRHTRSLSLQQNKKMSSSL